MPPDRSLLDAEPGQTPSHEDTQQLVEAESGRGAQGILRRWQASNSAQVVLTSDATGVKISRDAGATPPAQVIVDNTPAGGALTGYYPNPTVSVAGMDALIPPGTIWAYAGSTVPPGWLLCNGVGLPTTTYAKLFAAIGYTYGGSGAVFILPNLTGKVILGISGPHPLGDAGGTELGALHTHTGSHSHTPGSLGFTLSGHSHLQGTHTHDAGSHAHDIAGHSHGLTDHAHGPGSHTHDLNSHRHDIGHEHLSPPTHPAVTSASGTGLNGRFTAGGANALPDAHTHPYDVPALGVTNSGIPAVNTSTATPSANDTAGLTVAASTGTSGAAGFANTGTPTAVTGGVTAGAASVGTPSTDSTGSGTGSTAADSSAPAAAYSSTSANLPPYTAIQYIIRAGV